MPPSTYFFFLLLTSTKFEFLVVSMRDVYNLNYHNSIPIFQKPRSELRLCIRLQHQLTSRVVSNISSSKSELPAIVNNPSIGEPRYGVVGGVVKFEGLSRHNVVFKITQMTVAVVERHGFSVGYKSICN